MHDEILQNQSSEKTHGNDHGHNPPAYEEDNTPLGVFATVHRQEHLQSADHITSLHFVNIFYTLLTYAGTSLCRQWVQKNKKNLAYYRYKIVKILPLLLASRVVSAYISL